MNYSMKNTKEELIAMLDEQKHLAEAVEAKDKEIATNKGEYAAKLASLKTERDEAVALAKGHEKLAADYAKLAKENQTLNAFIRTYVSTFRNFLKAQQGVLDNTIELEALIVETSSKRGE